MEHLTYPIRSDKLTMTVAVTEHVASVQTNFQTIDIHDTTEFGRMLLLDGHVQLAERDEAAYHECFVHIPLSALPSATSALVVGGGDGGVVRELCRSASLESVTMVEIDEQVISVCREHLPSVSNGAFDDPRLNLVVGDAFAYVKDCGSQFDLILLDATDCYEEETGELSENLFTAEFYADCARILAPGGIVVTQADNPVFCPYSSEPLLSAFRQAFGTCGMYWALVPSFGGYSAYVWGSRGPVLPAAFVPGDGHKYLSKLTYDLAFSPVPF